MADPMIGKAEKVQMGKIKAPKQEAAAQPQAKPMTSDDIIRQSAQKEMPGSDVEGFMRKLVALVKTKKVQLLQIGNTVFLLQTKEPGTVEFHTFTIESPSDLVQRYKAGINSLKQMGFKKAYSYSTSPAFVKIAEQTGLPVRVTQSQQVIGDKAVPAYRFEVDI
jgi:hypothetical protein